VTGQNNQINMAYAFWKAWSGGETTLVNLAKYIVFIRFNYNWLLAGIMPFEHASSVD